MFQAFSDEGQADVWANTVVRAPFISEPKLWVHCLKERLGFWPCARKKRNSNALFIHRALEGESVTPQVSVVNITWGLGEGMRPRTVAAPCWSCHLTWQAHRRCFLGSTCWCRPGGCWGEPRLVVTVTSQPSRRNPGDICPWTPFQTSPEAVATLLSMEFSRQEY